MVELSTICKHRPISYWRVTGLKSVKLAGERYFRVLPNAKKQRKILVISWLLESNLFSQAFNRMTNRWKICQW